MPGALPVVVAGILQLPGGATDAGIVVGSPPWFAWLADPGTRSFAFHGGSANFTARKEDRQRGSAYWSAYRSVAGRVRKTYLGTADALTLERLERAAAALRSPSTATTPARAQISPAAPAFPALLRTKLFIPPPRRQLVARERLYQQLTAAFRQKLLVITGPVGSGKTTLLSAWHAAQRPPRIPLAWLALDEADNDPIRFWRYLCAALDSAAPGVGSTVVGLLSAPRQPLGNDALVAELLNPLAALTHDLILVLDDYHVIGEREIHQLLATLVERLPPQIHLVLTSRAEPPLPLARLRARGDLAELRASDLRFTVAEVGTLLNEQIQLDLAPELVTALAERTEGWAVGLHLAALALRGQEPADRATFLLTFSGSHRYIGDYLLEEVLHDQSATTRAFLLHTAILGRLCGPLCDAVMAQSGEDPGGAAMLEQLERVGLFLVPLDGERHWYRYHRLFAELLRKRLQQEFPAIVPDIYRRASAWCAAAGLFDEAIEYAFAAGDTPLAAALIERAAHATTIRNEHRTIQRWLTTLPPELVRARPQLGLARAWSLALRWPSPETTAYLEELEADPLYAPFAGEIAAYWAVSLILRDIPRCIGYGERALAQLPAEQVFLRSSASVSLGIAYWLSGDLANAERIFKLTIALNAPIVAQLTAGGASQLPPEQLGAIVPMLTAQQTLGDVRRIQGHLREAEDHFARAVALAGGLEGSLLPVFGAAQAAAYLASLRYEWNDLDGATQLLDQALDPVQQAVNGDQMWTIFRYAAQFAQARGDAPGAQEALRRVNEMTARMDQPFALILASLSRLRHHLARDDRTQSGAEATTLQGILARFGFPDGGEKPPPHYSDYIWEQQELALGMAALVGERPDEALRRAERVAINAEAVGHPGYLIPSLTLQALARAAQGEEEGALSLLALALAQAEPEGYVRTFIDYGEPLRLLLRRFLSRASREDAASERRLLAYTRHLLAAFAAPNSRVPKDPTAALPEPLSAREREILTMLADGLTNRDIAAHLFIASGTVKWHINRIFGKLAVTSRTAAVARARSLGLLS